MKIRNVTYSDLNLVLQPTLDSLAVNVIAMAAPEVFYDLRGKNYPLEHLVDLYNNAYTAFHLVKEFDQSTHTKKTHITTGRWGAGAFGHNVSMVIAIQYLAARMAGVDYLKFTGISEEEGQPVVQFIDHLLDATLSKSKKNTRVEAFLSQLLHHQHTKDWKTRPL
jgi:hypothetical protein